MNKRELNAAVLIARDGNHSLEHVDDTHLYGCGLLSFKPVVSSIEAAAKLIRWQCCRLDGSFDEIELNELFTMIKRKVTIVGMGAEVKCN